MNKSRYKGTCTCHVYFIEWYVGVAISKKSPFVTIHEILVIFFQRIMTEAVPQLHQLCFQAGFCCIKFKRVQK